MKIRLKNFRSESSFLLVLKLKKTFSSKAIFIIMVYKKERKQRPRYSIANFSKKVIESLKVLEESEFLENGQKFEAEAEIT